jgi:hypothetical protein
MAAIKWICGFESFAEAALIRQVYDAEPGRDGWQRRMNRENKAILAARLYELLGEREDCVMLRSRLRLKDEQELRGRSAWLKYVNQLLDTLSAPITSDPTRIRLSESAPLKRATLAALDGISTFVPNPAERLIELITKTLHEKPIIPITEYATNWAKVVVEVLGNAEEDIKYHLVAICRTIGRMLGVEEDPALVMTRILASHIDSYLFKSRIMRDMKEIQETKNYREQQLRCCKNMITSTRWICGLEHPDAIALIRQICDAEPDRVGRQSQMGIEDRAALALSLYELLGVQI